MVNIDEIDATTRDFFDRLKNLYKKQGKAEKTTMSSLDIRQHLRMSKTTVNRLLRTLVEFEYVKKEGYKILVMNIASPIGVN
jgi:CTP-dependent riboflavin kinase